MHPSRVLVLGSLALLASLPAQTASAATSVRSRHDNGSRATAQVVPLMPELVLKQKLPNDTPATSQPVSPTYYAVDVLGALSKRHREAYFGFAVVAGDTLHLAVAAKDPTKGFPELLLFDENGSLVAIANGNGSNGSDSVIDFAIPDGETGTWAVDVTGSPSHPGPKASFFPYDLRARTAQMPYRTDVLGHLTAKQKSGFYYGVAVNAGDHLHLAVAAKDPTKGFPELLLFDENGNLVAIANGNGSNGSDSVIDFTIPDGETGTWTVDVAGSPSADAKKNHFPYDLVISGATGFGPVVPK